VKGCERCQDGREQRVRSHTNQVCKLDYVPDIYGWVSALDVSVSFLAHLLDHND
jgi:hypothetical protein